MNDLSLRRSRWGFLHILRFFVFGALSLSLLAACGAGDDDEDESAAAPTTAAVATATTGSTGSGSASGATATSGGSSGVASLTGIGACFEENTTPEIIGELREGETESAEEAYRGCLEGVLPADMVDQLEPIIEEAAECGVATSEDLSDEDFAAIENGDEAKIEQVSADTLNCVSEELGIPLS